MCALFSLENVQAGAVKGLIARHYVREAARSRGTVKGLIARHYVREAERGRGTVKGLIARHYVREAERGRGTVKGLIARHYVREAERGRGTKLMCHSVTYTFCRVPVSWSTCAVVPLCPRSRKRPRSRSQ